MEQSLYCEANTGSAGQEIFHIYGIGNFIAVKIFVFKNVTQFNLADHYQLSGEFYCLHLQVNPAVVTIYRTMYPLITQKQKSSQLLPDDLKSEISLPCS
jgi:hypothetical protein